jgi:hypothetical protein
MSIPVFVAPEYKPVTRHVAQIPFTATVGVTTQLTLVSNRITFKYKVTAVEIVFRDDTANALQIYVLVSNNTNTSTTTVPPDLNIFSTYSATPYFVGEGSIKKAECSVLAPDGYPYVKVHAINLNAYTQTVNVTVTIEEVPE